jgi:hypothetical protein
LKHHFKKNTSKELDHVTAATIMSNRRFWKVFGELGKMNKAEASQLVNSNHTQLTGNA